jgi:hypothetical protein
MSKQISLITGCVLTIALGAVHTALAQSDPRPTSPASASPYDDWRKDATVLAIAPDGTWGTATELSVGPAIANAINDCKSKYQGKIGCGYRSVTVRAGWILGFRCGAQNIIVAEKRLADAERTAMRREQELRAQYVPNMPVCVRTVTVDPSGDVIAPAFAQREEAVPPR